MVVVDPGLVRGAGVRYAEARAVCLVRAAFHPKLVVKPAAPSAAVTVAMIAPPSATEANELVGRTRVR
jgi:hypothetical protein